ncbi:MAG: YbaB/EbfC family nucleoid-associated protein [Desulfovibrio sp.]|nr:YbaB/EbfC family nucleoid-associated protein [Desulfovibrio sp.]
MRNMNDILRQAQVMQRKLSKLQEEMADRTYEASSGGGMVKAVVTGKQELKSLTIDPATFENKDVEMLQDLILAAVNEAGRIARESMDREMNNLSGGIKLPGLF